MVGQAREDITAFGFLDGDFLERFRTYSVDERSAVLNGKDEYERLDVEEVKIQGCLEELQRLH